MPMTRPLILMEQARHREAEVESPTISIFSRHRTREKIGKMVKTLAATAGEVPSRFMGSQNA